MKRARTADDGSPTRSTFRSKTNELAAISRRTLRANVSRTALRGRGGKLSRNNSDYSHGERAIWYKSHSSRAALHAIVRLNRRGRMGLRELIAKLCLSRGDTCKNALPYPPYGISSRVDNAVSKLNCRTCRRIYLSRSTVRLLVLCVSSCSSTKFWWEASHKETHAYIVNMQRVYSDAWKSSIAHVDENYTRNTVLDITRHLIREPAVIPLQIYFVSRCMRTRNRNNAKEKKRINVRELIKIAT